MSWHLVSLPLSLALASLLAAPDAQAADPPAIEPKCDTPFVYGATKKACQPSAGFKDLKGALCTDNFGTLAADQCTAPATD